MRKLANGAKVHIIGLSGRAGSGKDYIARNYILPYGFFSWAFAWPLKTLMIGKELGTFEELFVTKPLDKRKLMQYEGTDNYRHNYGDNIWVNSTAAWLTLLNEFAGVNGFVISDARFPNEIEFIQSMGGKVYYIDSPTRTNTTLVPMDEESRKHASETSLQDLSLFDGIIDNNLGRTDVQEQVEALMLRDGFLTVTTEGAVDGEYEDEIFGAGCQ